MSLFFAVICLLAGSGLPVQAAANAQLSKAVGSPFAATTLQLAIAALVLLVVTLVTGTMVAFVRVPEATWWHLLAGTASALYVVSTILIFPRIGAVMAVSLIIAGQTFASMMLDMFGLLGVPAVGPRAGIMVGAALVTGGAILIARSQASGEAKAAQFAWIALALVAGGVLPVQGAVNALLRKELDGAAFAVGTVSFLVAMLAMGAVHFGSHRFAGQAKASFVGLPNMPWWGWLGGFAGASYVTAVFTAFPVIGAAATIGLTVAGQQLASLAVDQFGLLRLPKRTVGLKRLVAVGMLLFGVAAIKLL